jgi:hypothetical protein
MRNFLSYLIVFGGFLFFSSCEKVAFDPPKIEGQVSFKTDVAPPLNNDCGKCHAPLKTQANFYKSLATTAFIDTVNAKSSKIYTKLSNNPAHQGYTSPDNLAKILLWFEQGAKNN